MTGRSIQHFGFSDPHQEAWTGPVERVDSIALRRPCLQLTWRCANEFCRNWTMDGAHEYGRCNFCFEPRPL